MGSALYDEIGRGYARTRRSDPAIAAAIDTALGDARSVLCVGAGTGSYEPSERSVVALDPSAIMISQRPAGLAPTLQGVAGALPVRADAFDAALAVLTIHHWPDVAAGLAEMRRVATRQVVLTFDPAPHCRHWLTEYLPELRAIFQAAPPIDQVAAAIAAVEVQPIPLAHDTPDGMTIAYWRRPQAYLDPELRAGGSALQQIDPAALEQGLRRLEADLSSGAWEARHGELLAATEMDYGLRLVFN